MQKMQPICSLCMYRTSAFQIYLCLQYRAPRFQCNDCVVIPSDLLKIIESQQKQVEQSDDNGNVAVKQLENKISTIMEDEMEEEKCMKILNK